MEYDLKNSVKSEAILHEDAAGASTVGAIIDTRGFESLTYIITSGTITTGTFTVVLEESDVITFGGEETVVDSELVLGTISFAASDDDDSQRVGIVGKKRFQRLTLVGASTPVAEMSGIALLGHAQTRPTAE